MEVIRWIVGFFFVISSIVYFNEITIPAILLLISGIVIIPPINNKVKEKNINKYVIFLFVFFSFCIFFGNIPTDENAQNNSSEISELNAINTVEVISNEIDITNTIEITETEKDPKYIGEKVDNQRNGQGSYYWDDGQVYQGMWENDTMNGKGTLTTISDGRYEGNYKNGKRSGDGKYYFSNGDVYDGNWENDEMSGKGKYTFVNGDVYEGEFSENKFNGQGTYTLSNGKKYSGTWVNNEYQK